VCRADLVEVAALDETARSGGGFGHTGVASKEQAATGAPAERENG